MLDIIKDQLKNFPIKSYCPKPESQGNTAAVMLILHGDPGDPLLVLTQRAAHLNNHAGEVALPGGMWDAEDKDLLTTALRETEEEIGLSPSLVTPIAMLPSGSPKTREITVTPFVGLAEGPLKVTPEPSEIASIFDFPIALMTDTDNYQYFELIRGPERFKMPYFPYRDYKIWGFTLNVLVDMLNQTLGTQIQLRYPDRENIERLRQRGAL
jgi:8-oxo-dGTP pyrophosphatase MutT (NUDIX family)